MKCPIFFNFSIKFHSSIFSQLQSKIILGENVNVMFRLHSLESGPTMLKKKALTSCITVPLRIKKTYLIGTCSDLLTSYAHCAICMLSYCIIALSADSGKYLKLVVTCHLRN